MSTTDISVPTDYRSFTVEELKKLLRARGLKVSGSKVEQVSRLENHDTKVDVDIDKDFLISYGLSFFNFDTKRLSKVKKETNIERFKNYFGLPPRKVLAVL